MDQQDTLDIQLIHRGLIKVRQRRWILWLTILAYLPAMMLSLQSTDGWNTVIKVFFLWLAALCVSVGMAVVVRCPECGNCFHTHGPSFLPVRRCVHCGLHVTADKKGDDRMAEEMNE